jgi:hypothetical protein
VWNGHAVGSNRTAHRAPPASASAGGVGCIGVQIVRQRARKVMMPRTGS